MAKTKPGMNDIFQSTTPGGPAAPSDNSDLDTGKVRPVGIGLTEGEIAALDQLAGFYQVNRHALLKLAVREFIKDVRAGKVDVESHFEAPPPPKKRLIK